MQRGLSQIELASGISTPSMISQIEAGKVRPTYTLMTKLADKLGFPIEQFMEHPPEQSILSAQLWLAEYWMLLGHYEKSQHILSTLETPPGPSILQQRCDYLKARVARLLDRPEDAIPLLDALFEEALRVQDEQLLFEVSKESGYVEYAMNRLEGARHHWSKAIDLGESLMERTESATTRLRTDLAETHFMMHEILTLMNEPDAAESAIEQAVELSKNDGRFINIAQSCIAEAEQAVLANDPDRANDILERVVTVADWGRMVTQHIRIQTTRSNSPSTSGRCDHRPIVTAISNPADFMDTELSRIEQLMDTRSWDVAERRIHRCLDIIQDYCDESPDFANIVSVHRIRLGVLNARCQQAQGRTEAALHALEQLASTASEHNAVQDLIEIQALAIHWFADAGRTKDVLKLSEKLEELLQQAEFQGYSAVTS